MSNLATIKHNLLQAYKNVRLQTETLCQPLAIEDYVIQAIEDVSPPKWHLAHTTWFFETFLLTKYLKNYQSFDPMFNYFFNSYYHGVGEPYPRARRGFLSRPTVETIYKYRQHVDTHLLKLIVQAKEEDVEKLQNLITLGINHEQQHQELLLMDIKYNFSINKSMPIYKENKIPITNGIKPAQYLPISSCGTIEIGHQGNNFSFDNESPRHEQLLKPFLLSNRLVTNGEYCEFIAAGGYQDPKWWLSDGWDCVIKNNWQAPLYWHKENTNWFIFTLSGLQKINLNEPVSHVSFYEADAYARWSGKRLPLEGEWEHFVTSHNLTIEPGNFLENGFFHPIPVANTEDNKAKQFFGDLWEWTASSYRPYPGFKPLAGALGEYNGKFMNNQMVLRGGCCATPQTHIRATYRNFFQPDKRWQFSGIRLAADD